MTSAKDTLIVIQCCKSKNTVELYPDHSHDLYRQIPVTRRILERAVKHFMDEGVIDVDSNPVTALSLYTGHFYSVEGLKDRMVEELLNGRYDFLIMSAGYGFVHPLQRVYEYDQPARIHYSKLCLIGIISGLTYYLFNREPDIHEIHLK